MSSEYEDTRSSEVPRESSEVPRESRETDLATAERRRAAEDSWAPPADGNGGAASDGGDQSAEVVRTWHSIDDVPPDLRERIGDGALDAMDYPMTYEKGPAPEGESYVAYTHYDWTDNGPDSQREPVTGRLDDVFDRRLVWTSPAGVEQNDGVMGSVMDIQASAEAQGKHVSVADVLCPAPGVDNSGADLIESRALKPEFDTPPSPAGLANPSPDLQFPGGAPQSMLLSYDPADCSATVRPVGETRAFGAPDRFDYPDRDTAGSSPEHAAARHARDVARNAQVTITFDPGAQREVVSSLTGPQRSPTDGRVI
jgi:hypothetical protein